MFAIEIDQSGRMEDLGTKTVLAMSNGIQRTMLVPVNVKRNCAKVLRKRGTRPKVVGVRMFVAGVFLLIEPHLRDISKMIIDLEYPGYEGIIKGRLLAHIWERDPAFPKEAIHFQAIGKKSDAHKLALYTFRGKIAPDKVVSIKELLQFA